MRDPTSGRLPAVGILFLARTVYAFNWYNIGALATLLEPAFGIGTAEFGIVLGMFLLGAGIFQVPAGFAAMRWGNRTTSLVALVVMGGFTLASAFSPNWIVLAGLRFGAGAGAALFFAPALGLVALVLPGRHARSDHRPLQLGIQPRSRYRHHRRSGRGRAVRLGVGPRRRRDRPPGDRSVRYRVPASRSRDAPDSRDPGSLAVRGSGPSLPPALGTRARYLPAHGAHSTLPPRPSSPSRRSRTRRGPWPSRRQCPR